MKLSNVTNTEFTVGAGIKEVYIDSPIPTTFAWHNQTNWKHAEELYLKDPVAWNELKRKNKIPLEVIRRVER